MIDNKWMRYVNDIIEKDKAVEIYRILEDYDEFSSCCKNNPTCEFKRLREKFEELFIELKKDPRKMKFFKWRLAMARTKTYLHRTMRNIPIPPSMPLEKYEEKIIERLRAERLKNDAPLV